MTPNCSMVLPRFYLIASVTLGCVLSWCAEITFAQSPLKVDSVSVLGLQSPGKTKVEIRGGGFNSSIRLHLPIAAKQEVLAVSPDSATLEITLEQVPSQYVWGVIRTDSAIDSPRRLVIDALPNLTTVNKVESLPAAISGNIAGNQTQVVEVSLNEGDVMTTDVQARRLGATFQPLLRVVDSQERQVSSSGPLSSLDGDAACVWQVKKSGVYRIILQDLTFSAPPSLYRLRIATNKSLTVTPTNNDLTGKNSPLSALAERVASPSNQAIDIFSLTPAQPDTSLKVSHTRSLLSGWSRVDSSILTSEELPNVGAVKRIAALPVVVRSSIAGRTPARFIVNLGAGKPLDAEVWSSRLASNLDARVRIRALDRRELAQGDDRPGTTDPRARFAGDPGIAEVLIEVDSLVPVSARGEDFELVLTQPARDPLPIETETNVVLTSLHGWGLLPIKIPRQGFLEPIELQAVAIDTSGIPIPESPVVIVPGSQERALIPVRMPTTSQPASCWIAVFAKFPSGEQTRIVQANVPGRRVNAFGAIEHAVCFSQIAAPILLNAQWNIDTNQPWELVAGTKQNLPLTWDLPALNDEQKQWKVQGEIVSTQHIPRTNPQDGNSPVDLKRALQIGGSTMATKPITEGLNWELVVPPTTPEDELQLSIKWTLKDAQDKALATTSLYPIKVVIKSPLKLELAEVLPNPWPWNSNLTKEGVKLRITKAKEISGTANIQWQGLPQGITAPPVPINLDQDVLELAVPLPDLAAQPAGSKLDGLKIVVEWKPEGHADAAPFVTPPVMLPSLTFP